MPSKATPEPTFNMADSIRKLVAKNKNATGPEIVAKLKAENPGVEVNEASAQVAVSNARKKLGLTAPASKGKSSKPKAKPAAAKSTAQKAPARRTAKTTASEGTIDVSLLRRAQSFVSEAGGIEQATAAIADLKPFRFNRPRHRSSPVAPRGAAGCFLLGEYMNNIMLDLETMATSSSPAITAIAAVKFSKTEIIDTFYETVSLKDSARHGLEIDPDTVVWWMQQVRDAQCHLWDNPRKLRKVLQELTAWMGPDPIIWGDGATADNVWLSNAYRAVKLPRPWSYRNDRCYRTLKSLYPDVLFTQVGTEHNAIDDAETQAKHLMSIFQRMACKPIELSHVFDD